MLNLIRVFVSENRCRYEDTKEGINLDLSYITDRIIAMSYPSTGFEALYRNTLGAVKNFLNGRHPGHYKVFNLRSEKGYGNDTFSSAPVATYGFDDHQAPPFQLLVSFCEDAKAWMTEDTENVVVIHCKAGKGRTGTVIAALLLYLHESQHAEEAIDMYGARRTKDGRGVTIPSQIRYVHYFERWLQGNRGIQMNRLLWIKQIVLHGAADICKHGLTLSITNHTATTYTFDRKNVVYRGAERFKDGAIHIGWKCDIQTILPNRVHVTLPNVPVQGDFRIMSHMSASYFKKLSCRLCLNTSFIHGGNNTITGKKALESSPSSTSVVKLSKDEIDGAVNDVDNRLFPVDFAVEIEFVAMVE